MTAATGPRAGGKPGRPRTDPARRAALDVLRAVGERDAYANLVLPSTLRAAGLQGRDAAFATELTYGTLRGLGTYDAIIAKCVDRPLGEVDRGVLDLLRLGAHQLLRMKVPVHAAVNTSVDLARTALGRGPSGFVNAVMRRLSARTLEQWLAELLSDAQGDVARVLALRGFHPQWIVETFHHALGSWEETERALDADNVAPGVTLVARPGRSTLDELVAAGAKQGRWSPWAAQWPGGDPATIPAVRDGRAGVQDEGSQLVALALATAPLVGGDARWLDLCAGPGGKTALLAGLAQQRGATMTAVELQEHRAELVRQSVGDMATVVTGDATDPQWATGDYDRVLVDVPCSGLGALRRRPEARWRRTPEDLARLRPLQEQLLTSALAAVRVGGVVGYITCSPALSETTEVVGAVLGGRSDVRQVDARPLFVNLPDLGAGPDIQLWPHRHGTDAMYLALLERLA